MTNQEQDELICEKAKKYDRLIEKFNKIRTEIEHEADYQDAYVNADIAKGMYLALEIFDRCKEGDNK